MGQKQKVHEEASAENTSGPHDLARSILLRGCHAFEDILVCFNAGPQSPKPQTRNQCVMHLIGVWAFSCIDGIATPQYVVSNVVSEK